MEVRSVSVPQLMSIIGVIVALLGDLNLRPFSSVAEGSISCQPNEFLFVSNETCLPCPPTCAECLPEVTRPLSPCMECSGNAGLYVTDADKNTNVSTIGGECLECALNDLGISTGVSNIRLHLVGAGKDETDESVLEGRVEVSFSGQWGAVCDDGWTDENVDVVCGELGLGGGLGFEKQYDILHSYLPSLNILMDNVNCTGKEDSLYECDFVGFNEQNCESGETIGLRCTGPKLKGPFCTATCPLSQTLDDVTMRCLDCTPPCLACGKAPEDCTACEPPLFLKPGGGKCLQSCSEGYYGNTHSRQCQPCSSVCKTCMDGARADVCTSCASGLLLFERTCVEECPNGTLLHWNGIAACVNECPEGFYVSNGICRKCSDACRACQGNRDNCTGCKNSLVLQPVPHHSPELLANYVITYSCQATCNEGFYANYKNSCLPCEDKNCAWCHLGGELCKTCKEGFLFQLGTCVRSCSDGLFDVDKVCSFPCSDGFYGNEETKRCEACGAPCRSCVETGVCTSCYVNHYLKNNTCVRDCGETYVTISFPTRSDVRLLGGQTQLEGRVEVYRKGGWTSVCVDEWSHLAANVVCGALQRGKALTISKDHRFGRGNLALVTKLHCHGNDTDLSDCFEEGVGCTAEGAGVYCSGPSLGSVKECHVANIDPCDERPCADGVKCWATPGGDGQRSRCGPCPRGTRGNGRFCQERDKPTEKVRILFPSSPVKIKHWPEGVQITLPVVTSPVAWQLVHRWYKDGRELKTNANYRIEESGSLTIFFPVGLTSSGMYRCVVGTNTVNVTATYQLSVLESVRILSPPRSHVADHRGVILVCVTEGLPRPTVSWRKDGEPLDFGRLGDRARANQQGTLLIRDVRGTDSGLYTCTAHNKYTMATASAYVTIKATPRILNKEPHTVAIAGTMLRLHCDVTGGPTPKVFWKRNNDDVIDSPRIDFYDNGTLLISHVREEDAGIYRCVALNAVGPPDVWVTNVTVLVAPSAVVTPSEIMTSVGGETVFRCESDGQPTPDITWLTPTRGRVIQTNANTKVEVTGGGGRSVLTLLSVRSNDTGFIHCVAQNDAGQYVATAKLTVRVAPLWPRSPRPVWLLAGRSATLHWPALARPLASYIWFRDGLELREGKRYEVRGGAVTFTPEYPYDSGTYSVQASNTEGTAVTSAHVEIVRNFSVPKVKYVALTNFTLNMHGIPSKFHGASYEIVVVCLGINGSGENISTSPLDLLIVPQSTPDSRGQKVNTSVGYITLLYDRLPRHVTVGDGKRYASIRSKRSVLNVPLVAGEWYAIAVRMIRYQHAGADAHTGRHWSPARHPVGGTEYAYVFTEHKEQAQPVGSGRTWQVALASVFGVVLCLIAVIGCFVLFYWRRHGYLPFAGLTKLLWQGRRQKGQLEGSSSPIDVERYLSQFNPNPSPARGRPPRGGATGSSSETISTSVSTIYIPTEDEIDSLESIGIHYYEDDNWMSRVPSGVLSISRARLDLLRREGSNVGTSTSPRPSTSGGKYAHASTSSDVDGLLSFQRTNSDPAMVVEGISKKIAAPVLERTSSEPVVSVPEKRTKSNHQKGVANKAFHKGSSSKTTRPNPRKGKQPTKEIPGSQGAQVKAKVAHKPVGKTSSGLSKDSKQSDSGFESPRRAAKGSKAMNSRRKAPTGGTSDKRHRPQTSTKGRKVKSGTGRKRKNTSKKGVTTRQKTNQKERKVNTRVKRFSNWPEKGLKKLRDKSTYLLSRGRQWARKVLDKQDTYGIYRSDSGSTSDNRDSEIEMEQIRQNPVGQDRDDQSPRKASTRLNQDQPSTELDGEYIDPSSIMSIPTRKLSPPAPYRIETVRGKDLLRVDGKDIPDMPTEIIIEDLSGEPRTEMTSFMTNEAVTILLDETSEESSISESPDAQATFSGELGRRNIESDANTDIETDAELTETPEPKGTKDEESQTDLCIVEEDRDREVTIVATLTTIVEDSTNDDNSTAIVEDSTNDNSTADQVSLHTRQEKEEQDPRKGRPGPSADLTVPETPQQPDRSHPLSKSTHSYLALLNVLDKEEKDCKVCNEVHESVLAETRTPCIHKSSEPVENTRVRGRVGGAPMVPPRPSGTISSSSSDDKGSNEYISLIDASGPESGIDRKEVPETQVSLPVVDGDDDLYQELSPTADPDVGHDVTLASPLRLLHKDSLLLPRNSTLRVFNFNTQDTDCHKLGQTDIGTSINGLEEEPRNSMKPLPGGVASTPVPQGETSSPLRYDIEVHTDISSVVRAPKPKRLVIPEVFTTK